MVPGFTTLDALSVEQLDLRAGSERGHLKQFLTVPVGAETCEPFITGDDRSVFVAVQHPGEICGAGVENRPRPGRTATTRSPRSS